MARSDFRLTNIKGLGAHYAAVLTQNGITSVKALAAASAEAVATLPGIGEKRAAALQQAARDLLGSKAPEPAPAAPEPPSSPAPIPAEPPQAGSPPAASYDDEPVAEDDGDPQKAGKKKDKKGDKKGDKKKNGKKKKRGEKKDGKKKDKKGDKKKNGKKKKKGKKK